MVQTIFAEFKEGEMGMIPRFVRAIQEGGGQGKAKKRTFIEKCEFGWQLARFPKLSGYNNVAVFMSTKIHILFSFLFYYSLFSYFTTNPSSHITCSFFSKIFDF